MIDLPDGLILLEPRAVFDRALVGTTTAPADHWPRQTATRCAVYNSEECVEAMIECWGIDHDAALDHFGFNTAGAWVGEGTPTFVSMFDDGAL